MSAKSLFKNYIPVFLLIAATAFLILESERLTENVINETAPAEKVLPEKSDSVIAEIPIKKSYDRRFNDVARYISGLPQDSGSEIDSSFLTNDAWKSFSRKFTNGWKYFDSTRLALLRDFSSKELVQMDSGMYTLFYPFSGPDILNAQTFFPHAEKTIMIGLEPVGVFPDLNHFKKDTLSGFFNAVDKSLYAILHFSFFRTVAMKVDLCKELDGTIPVMAIFLSNMNNTILDVEHLHVNREGKIEYDSMVAGNTNARGVEITYRTSGEATEKKLYYFSVDISNGGLQNVSPEFLIYLKSLGGVRTYLKSASFLMHSDYFSEIRNFITSNSNFVFQDDSGIPLNFFDGSWEKTFYGTYSGTIPMFSKYVQQDLKIAFSNTNKVRPLNFGIGYKWKLGTSNLMLFKKIKTARSGKSTGA